ncbi:hypothetical protein BC834DRAFT_63103 [Gloeopeniophorella convolvens]|nr:hypothetical protein BC834DRAFT_63103 [Gloeopeniophorella convolvens]
MEDLAWQYPAEPVERAALRFCEALARWRGKPELETVRAHAPPPAPAFPLTYPSISRARSTRSARPARRAGPRPPCSRPASRTPSCAAPCRAFLCLRLASPRKRPARGASARARRPTRPSAGASGAGTSRRRDGDAGAGVVGDGLRAVLLSWLAVTSFGVCVVVAL